MAKTYEELLAAATQIKNNELPESNTHTLVGGQLVDMVERQKEDVEEQEKKVAELEEKLINISDSIGYSQRIKFEQGTLDATTGQPLSSSQAGSNHSKRIRTPNYISITKDTKKIYIDSARYLYTVYYYNSTEDDVLEKTEYTSSETEINTNYKYLKIIVKSAYDSGIDSGDVLMHISNPETSIDERLKAVENAVFEKEVSLIFEQGTLDSETGQPLTQQQGSSIYALRIRTKDYIKNNGGTIRNNSNGTLEYTVYYFSSIGGNVLNKDDYTSENISLSADYPYFKIICRKADSSNITPDYGNSITYVEKTAGGNISLSGDFIKIPSQHSEDIVIDFSQYTNLHQQILTTEDGGSWDLATGIIELQTIDSYVIPVTEGEKYTVTAIAGYNQVIVTGLNSSEFSLDSLVSAIVVENGTKFGATKAYYKDVEFSIPSGIGITHILVMGRNATNSAFESGYELSLTKVNGEEAKGLTTLTNKVYNPYTSEFKRFKVVINKAPLGVYNDANSENPTTNPDNENNSPATVTGVIALPTNYTRNGDKCKAIMLMMGGHGYVNDTMWYPSEPTIVDTVIPYFLSRGYAVFSCNGMKDMTYEEFQALSPSGFTSNLGLPDTIEAYWKSYQYVINNYNIDPIIFLWGGSQGGYGVLNFTKMHANVVRAVACMGGMVDLQEQGWKLTGARGKDRIVKILGFSSSSSYENDKADPWDPSKRIIPIGDQEMYFFPVPIKVCYGTSDEVLVNQQYIKRLANAIINAKCTIYCKWYEGYNHMDVAFGFKEVVRKDIIDWFDRF